MSVPPPHMKISSSTHESVILVISPLVAIIKDQVRKHPSWGNHGSHMHIVLLAADLYLHQHSIPQNAPLLTFSKLVKSWSKKILHLFAVCEVISFPQPKHKMD